MATLALTSQPVPSIRGHLQYSLVEVPRQVRLESSAYCNLNCLPCHGHGYKRMTRPKGFMRLDLVETLLKEMAQWRPPLQEIVPTNFGEWFLHPQWYEMALLIDQHLPRTRLVLPTTGILVREPVLHRLVSLRTLKHINFSVNAYFSETYDRFHGRGAGLAERHLLRIRSMIDQLKDMRPDVTVWVSMVYDPRMQTEIERELFEMYWSQVATVQVSYASYTGDPARAPDVSVTLPCRSVFDGLVVFWDGRVGTNCCWDADADLQVGATPGEKLLDIWKGERLARLARTHNEGRREEIPLCSECTFA